MPNEGEAVAYYTITPEADGLIHVRLNAREINAEAKGPFGELAGRIAEAPVPKRVVLNMSSVRAINSAAIAMLIHLQKRVRDAGGRIKFCEIDHYVKNILTMTKVDQILEIHDTEAEAADAFHGKEPASSEGPGVGGGWFSKLFGK